MINVNYLCLKAEACRRNLMGQNTRSIEVVILFPFPDITTGVISYTITTSTNTIT